MTSTIKQAGYFLVSSFVLGISLHAAAAVYSCGNGSGHQGSGYHLNIRSLNASDERASAKPKKKARAEKSDKQEKKADKPSKNKNSAKAKKQQPIPSEQE